MSGIGHNGGPAFPRPISDNGQDHPADRVVSYAQDGMSLRDYFAGQALQGIMAGYWGNPEIFELSAEVISNEAYIAADAMLKARGET